MIKKLWRFLFDKDYRFRNLALRGFYDSLSDREYIIRMFKSTLGYDLNIENPVTFSEKIQWLKLNDRNPLYTIMVDKYEVKKYVAGIIGKEYIVPTIGVWDDPNDIDFNKLPNQFVLKCNHNSGLGMCICKDKSKLNVERVKSDLRKGLAQDFYLLNREWPYKDVKRKIIAEEYLCDSIIGDETSKLNKDLIDYKFYCFNGVPSYCQVIMNRSTNETIDFYDMDWQLQSFTGLNKPNHPYPHSNFELSAPYNFEYMKIIASKLSSKIPFARIDFYEVQRHLYFGEITFFPAGGFAVFEPDNLNYEFGNRINLFN